MSSLVMVAVTHQHAPFALLERVALDADAADALAVALLGLPGIHEAAILSTCNRTELYVSGTAPDRNDVLTALSSHCHVPIDDLRRVALMADGDAVSLHLFRVAAGLESRVVGEGEILGQIRSTAARAASRRTAGPVLNDLFRWAAATGRRARRDAGGAARPSLARMAVDAVGGEPSAVTRAVVLGAGAMAAAVTAELSARHIEHRVCARRPESAARLTRRPEHALPLDALAGELTDADVVVCATAARTPIVTTAFVADAMLRRDGRPLTILDLSMPRNVAPDVAAVPGVRLIDLERLSGRHGDIQVRRSTNAVTAEHERYRTWLAGRQAGRLIEALHRHVHEVCRSEAAQILGPRADEGAVRRLAHGMAGKILHRPTLRIKELTAADDRAGLEAMAAAFGLAPLPSLAPLPGLASRQAAVVSSVARSAS